jgi:hypothetical protein
MDELPPSGLQDLNQGFRLVVQLVEQSLRLAQSRNFLLSTGKLTQFSNGPIDQTTCQYNLCRTRRQVTTPSDRYPIRDYFGHLR